MKPIKDREPHEPERALSMPPSTLCCGERYCSSDKLECELQAIEVFDHHFLTSANPTKAETLGFFLRRIRYFEIVDALERRP